MREKVEITGVMIDNITLKECDDILNDYLENDNLNTIFTPNSEFLYNAVKNPEFENILNQAQLLIPDGIGLVIASRFYKTPLKERVTGIDVMEKLFELADEKNKSVYLLGALQEVVDEAALKLIERFKNLNIVGRRNGYFTEQEEDLIIDEINNREVDILIVGLGSPRQEKFIHRNKDRIRVKIVICIGGGLDIISGRTKRAPIFMQKAGLEWLYRFAKQPSRIGRILKLPKFILLAYYDSKTRNKK